MAIVAFGKSLKKRIVPVIAVPNQMLRPNEEPIASKTKIAIANADKRLKAFQSLQKMSDAKSGKQSSKNPP